MAQVRVARLIQAIGCGTQARSGGLGRVHGWEVSGRITGLDSGEGRGKSGWGERLDRGISFNVVDLNPNVVQGPINMDGYYE